MEPRNDNKEQPELDTERAEQKSPGRSTTSTSRRAARGRGAGRSKTDGPCPSDTNGAATRASSSGRVLRDRSTRVVPAWRLNETSGDMDELTKESAPNRRRKPSCPRRRKNATLSSAESAGGSAVAELPSSHRTGETCVRAPRGRKPLARSRTASNRPPRGSPRTVCKSEPDSDSAYVDGDNVGKRKGVSEKKTKEEGGGSVLDDEEAAFQDDPKDQTYQPASESGEDEAISSDEDVPFRDDLNDQSYDPKTERDPPKARRRAPPRQREKKEKVQIKEKEKEPETEIKMEGGESADVKLENELGEIPDPPRKRGRRRKDDKSPRLPKRRKKPPVQYVRCEMEGCGTVLAHPRYLQHHIKYQHLLKKKYVCPHPSCGRLFRLQKQLLRHAKHHTDQRDYICEFCARAFKSSHNLAVHRMIHTGEKPLQCEICGFTCRQKASLNWHMKKHDADASYQFSCSICGKKFEKKDSVVAHKAKSHPEVLIAEALAANAGALITTPGALLEAYTGPMQTEPAAPDMQAGPVVQEEQAGQMAEVSTVSEVGPVAEMGSVSQVGPVMVVEQEHTIHTMQVPVTLSLPAAEDDGSVAAASHQLPGHALQMPLQFVSAPVSQHQPQIQQLPIQTAPAMSQQQIPLQTYSPQPQILHMTFRTVPQPQQHIQQLSLLSGPQQLALQSHSIPSQPQGLAKPTHNSTPNPTILLQAQTDAPIDTPNVGFSTGSAPSSSSSPPAISSQEPVEGGVVWGGDVTGENGGGAWERAEEAESQGLTDSSDVQIQHGLM